MNKDILICGVGGQGSVLASKLIASSAMAEGNTVHSAETIGMAQRGGPVTSHVRIGSEAYSPLIPSGCADIILGFEPAEVVRNIKYLNKDGIAIVNTTPTMPVTESLSSSGYTGKEMTNYLKENFNCIFVDGEKECSIFGSSKFLNIILLGVALGSGKLGLSKETLLDEIKKRVPQRFIETNINAFLHGLKIAGGNNNEA
ncbi:MAG: indolepyruvate oxidoreductase subunit beta [Eubacterium sp.]|nr:indolepyruvate oxidoreductase subunit beta [Eubacterium sp.]